MSNDTKEQLKEVNKAISGVLIGGQSVKLGSRMVTRADLPTLYSMRKDLEAQLDSTESGQLMDRTFVALFDGR